MLYLEITTNLLDLEKKWAKRGKRAQLLVVGIGVKRREGESGWLYKEGKCGAHSLKREYWK